MSGKLTVKQTEILEYIKSEILSKGYPLLSERSAQPYA